MKRSLFLIFLLFACESVSPPTVEKPLPEIATVKFDHEPDNQTLVPNGELSPNSWFCYPEAYQDPPRTTYLAVDEGTSPSNQNDWIHACHCEGGCQAQTYEFTNYSGSGAIEVHDINFKVDLTGCKDALEICGGQTAAVTLQLDYYIGGVLQGTQTWTYTGPLCADELWTPSFSNLSYTRSQINSLRARLTIGGGSFCEGSTTVYVWALEAAVVATEEHGGGGCHCEPQG
jgi:hypothetical protein